MSVLGPTVPVLALGVTSISGETFKLDSMVEVDITVASTAAPLVYTITYQLEVDNTLLAETTMDKTFDTVTGVTYTEIPNLTWVNTPGTTGAHTYEINVGVTGTNIATADAVTRALNAIQFPS